MGSETPSDESMLVASARAGSFEAFETLVIRYQDRIYGLIHRMVGDPEKALDLSQETFLKAWRGLSSFHGRSAFFTWLYRIARNVVTSAGRYESARPRVNVSLDESPGDEGGPAVEPAGDDSDPVDRVLGRERRRLVLHAIGQLSSDFREIIVLRDMEDRSYEDIAELLEIPVGTVRSRLHRARLELKERLRHVLNPLS